MRSNISAIMKAMEKIMTLPLFKIRIDQDQMLPNEDEKLSQLLKLTRSEDQEDGKRC